TVTFSDYANGSYALGYPVTVFLNTDAVTTTETAPSDRWSFAPLFPNPARSTSVTLQVVAPQRKALRIEIVNALGQVVLSRSETVPQGLSRISLPVGRLGAGSYIVRSKTEDGTVIDTQSFVRQ
ncbi:MAG: hypothetical protein JWP27_361, partial [Flaviaesturariibacter sp.]|nr:hypothetical protein [Flaviaesturariibacter sp.]